MVDKTGKAQYKYSLFVSQCKVLSHTEGPSKTTFVLIDIQKYQKDQIDTVSYNCVKLPR